jgi:hypothetical protein
MLARLVTAGVSIAAALFTLYYFDSRVWFFVVLAVGFVATVVVVLARVP